MPRMVEIERKFLLLRTPSEIERRAAEQDVLKSRRLLQQRYLDLKGWRIRIRKRMPADGPVGYALILKKDALRVTVTIDAGMHDKLADFCAPPTVEILDAGGTCEKRKLREPADWVFRIRRTSRVTGACAKHELTMKKPISDASCHEPECVLSAADHDAIAAHCGPVLRKRRLRILHAGRIWEVDSFLNPELAGLALAEVELPSECARLSLPDWAGREVTGDREYRNAVIEKRLAA